MKGRSWKWVGLRTGAWSEGRSPWGGAGAGARGEGVRASRGGGYRGDHGRVGEEGEDPQLQQCIQP